MGQLSFGFDREPLPRWAKPLPPKSRRRPLCYFCCRPFRLDIFEYWPDDRSFMIDTCCEGAYNYYSVEMAEWSPAEWQAFWLEKAGIAVRSVGGEPARREQTGLDPLYTFTVDAGITLVRSQPIKARVKGQAQPGALSRDEIREYVRQVHSHAPEPPAGLEWGYAVYNGQSSDPVYDGKPRFSSKKDGVRPLNLISWPPTLIGVAMVGRPGARRTQEQATARGEKIAEVSRVALNHQLPDFLTWKASSMIYEAAYDEACARGYTKAQTFTLASESGMSLRYARWKRVGESKGGQASRPSRQRRERTAELAQPKVRWERVCKHEPPP